MADHDALREAVEHAFAEDLAPAPTDDALVNRLVAQAMAAPPEGAPLPRDTSSASGATAGASGTLLKGAVVLLLAGGAAWWGLQPPAEDPPPPGAAEAPAAPAHALVPVASAHTEPTSTEPPSAPESSIPPLPPPADAPAEPPAAAPETRRSDGAGDRPRPAGSAGPTLTRPASKRPAAPAEQTAAELLRAANRVRRAGKLDRADAQFRELARRYPGSREEVLARVTHGRLLLERMHDPAAALERFDAYLADRPRGVLAEEALAGRARALEALGRHPKAREAWRRLLERFPDSAHAATARARLEGP